jgi:signal peptidase I
MKKVNKKEKLNKKNDEEFLSKEWIISNAKTIFFAILIALFIRTFLFQPFFIPSPSMVPTLLIGDRLFASKYDYGFSRNSLPFRLPLIENRKLVFELPERGDVIIFKPPHENRDFIKRLIGMPGDEIKTLNGDLYINSNKVEKNFLYKDKSGANIYEEILPNGVKHLIRDLGYIPMDNLDEFPGMIVPEGHYFFMGDNRDNSSDSRTWGTVPFERIVGKAQIIFFSTQGGSKMYEIWKWPFGIQYKRLLNLIN